MNDKNKVVEILNKFGIEFKESDLGFITTKNNAGEKLTRSEFIMHSGFVRRSVRYVGTSNDYEIDILTQKVMDGRDMLCSIAQDETWESVCDMTNRELFSGLNSEGYSYVENTGWVNPIFS